MARAGRAGDGPNMVAADVERRYARLLARTFRARMPYGMLAFLAVSGATALPELSMHPELATTFLIVLALQAQIWLLAHASMRRPSLSYARAVTISLLTMLGMVILITGYHVVASGDAEVLLLSLSCVTVGAVVLFPWNAQAQLVVASASVLAYAIGLAAGIHATTPSSLHLVGLATIAALTVGSVILIDQYRRRFFRLAARRAARHVWQRYATMPSPAG